MTSQETSRRLTVQEAAEVLGTSVDAVRMRARRGNLPSEKDPDGRVYVWVNADEPETKPRLNGESAALISAKDETIRILSEQLEAEREAHREARRIIAGLVQRIPELEAPADTPAPSQASEEAPHGAANGAGGPAERQSDEVEAQSSAVRRSWWREFFGFGG